MQATLAQGLDRVQVLRFHEDGYLGPFALCTPEEMAGIRARIEQEVLTRDGPNPKSRDHNRHLDSRVVYDLAAHSEILSRAATLFGPDLVCWSSNFFTKEPGGKEIPWHQDFNYWPIDPPLNLSAWLAIDRVTEENSCCRIIPGSHHKIVPHISAAEGMAFGEMADPRGVDESKAIPMELEPGEFFLFNERLLHQSHRNRSSRRRMGFAVRLTLPFVKVPHDVPPLFPGHRAVLVAGEDRFGLNRLQQPPETRA